MRETTLRQSSRTGTPSISMLVSGKRGRNWPFPYARTGDARGALDQYVRAADLLPEDVDVQIAAGTLLLAARKPEDAVARADAALKVQPDNVSAHVLRGNALAGLSSFDEALKSIDEALRLDPKRGATYTSLGFLQLTQGRRERCGVVFQACGRPLAKGNRPATGVG